jgi:hypothetical protein
MIATGDNVDIIRVGVINTILQPFDERSVFLVVHIVQP